MIIHGEKSIRPKRFRSPCTTTETKSFDMAMQYQRPAGSRHRDQPRALSMVCKQYYSLLTKCGAQPNTGSRNAGGDRSSNAVQILGVLLALECYELNDREPYEDGESNADPLLGGAGLVEFSDTPSLNRKIFRGYRVSILEHPYVVSVRRQLAHYVTGTLLSKNIVITVAQAVYGVPIQDLGLVVGENYADRGTAVYTVILVVTHDDFDPYTLHADVALMRTFEDLLPKVSVKPIRLINHSIADGDRAFVTGWGRCDWTGKELCLPRSSIYYRDEVFDPMLRTISFDISLNSSYCRAYKHLEGFSRGGILCLGPNREENVASQCMAVPGAPLVVNATLVGLQSWGYACGYTTDLPVIYTSLLAFKEWLSFNKYVLSNFTQKSLQPLFVVTRSYLMWKWLNETRLFQPNGHVHRGELQILELDKGLAHLQGKVYDVRNFIDDSKYSDAKKIIYTGLKEKLKNLKKIKDEKVNLSEYSKPFISNESSLFTDDDNFNHDIVDLDNYGDENYLALEEKILEGDLYDSSDSKATTNIV